MKVTELGIITLESDEPVNASLPMLNTESGIVMHTSVEQHLNAPSQIIVTGKPLYCEGITTSVSVHIPIPVTE